jgi:hypothetical protein
VSAGRIGFRRAPAVLALGLLLALGFLLLADRDTSPRPGLPAALQQEAIRRIEEIPLRGVEVAEIDCGPLRAGHVACPALVETQDASAGVVFHLGRGQEQGELVVESIKLTEDSAELIRSQF